MMQPNSQYIYSRQAYEMPTYERLLINCGMLTETNKALQNENANLKGALNSTNQKVSDLHQQLFISKNLAVVAKRERENGSKDDGERGKKDFEFLKQFLLELCIEALSKIAEFNEKRIQSIVDLEIVTSPETMQSSEILSVYHKSIVLLEDLQKNIFDKESTVTEFKTDVDKATNFNDVMTCVKKVNIQAIINIINDLIVQFFEQYVSILQQLLRYKKSLHKKSLQTTSAVLTFSVPPSDTKKPSVKEILPQTSSAPSTDPKETKKLYTTKTEKFTPSSTTNRKTLKDSLKEMKLNKNFKEVNDIKNHPHYSFISSNEKYRSLFNKLTKELEGKSHIKILEAIMEVRKDHKNCLSLLKYTDIVSKVRETLEKNEVDFIPVLELSARKDPSYETCGICIQPIYMSGAKKLPCKHIFHKDCIQTWVKANHTCPICRIFVP